MNCTRLCAAVDFIRTCGVEYQLQNHEHGTYRAAWTVFIKNDSNNERTWMWRIHHARGNLILTVQLALLTEEGEKASRRRRIGKESGCADNKRRQCRSGVLFMAMKDALLWVEDVRQTIDVGIWAETYALLFSNVNGRLSHLVGMWFLYIELRWMLAMRRNQIWI